MAVMTENIRTDRLNGRVALVTGGSRGIGAAVAIRLAAEGADVALTYLRDADSAASVIKQITAGGRRGLAIQADSADTAAVVDAVNTVADTLGRLDILVNNASLFPSGPIDEVGLEQFDETIAVNVRTPFAASTAAVKHMINGGRIVSIGSNVAERTVFPGYGLYVLSKTALTGLTKGLARDLGPRGITANLVHPGPTDTALNPADGPYSDVIRSITALGRYAEPAEIAATVAHLASDDGRYITGAAIHVDGGFTV